MSYKSKWSTLNHKFQSIKNWAEKYLVVFEHTFSYTLSISRTFQKEGIYFVDGSMVIAQVTSPYPSDMGIRVFCSLVLVNLVYNNNNNKN